MYSLYRAWLSLGPCGTLQSSAPLQLPGAPDVALQVGPTLTHFSAHRAVLATHSGYFKAALTTHSGHNPIAVPNVNVDEFSSLLTFMYTGFLDLNINNIYNILLATHILHMPRALELCRNYLIQQHPMEAAAAAGSGAGPPAAVTHQLRPPGGVIKPIPSRKVLLPPHHQQFYQPILGGGYSNLHSSDATPFRAVEKQESERRNNECAPSTSKKRATPPHLAELPDTTTHHPTAVPKAPAKQHFGGDRKPKKRSEAAGSYNHASAHSHAHSSASKNNDSDKTIIDIACCDGPVRFHRVINNNYGLTALTAANSDSMESTDVASSTMATSKEVTQRNDAMNKAMTASINNKKLLCDENSQQQSGGAVSGTGTDLFTCVYCNHTFKSQYCYQKHARRHLNPVSLDAGAVAAKPVVAAATAAPVGVATGAAGDGNRREVKLLDMNVQYYPCKTCGSKFPSYYFVHKHRKLCHAEEMQADGAKNIASAPQTQQSAENESNVDVLENDSSSDDKNDSTIDVVETSE